MNYGTRFRVNIDKFVDVGNYRWTTDDSGNEIFEPIPGRMARLLGLTGLFVGLFWCASAILVPNRLFQVLLYAVGGFFHVFSFLLGTILDHFGKFRGPLLILRRNRTIVLPRQDEEIVPNEETYIELVPDSEKPSDMRITLVICHGEERWPAL